MDPRKEEVLKKREGLSLDLGVAEVLRGTTGWANLVVAENDIVVASFVRGK